MLGWIAQFPQLQIKNVGTVDGAHKFGETAIYQLHTPSASGAGPVPTIGGSADGEEYSAYFNVHSRHFMVIGIVSQIAKQLRNCICYVIRIDVAVDAI